MAVRPISVKMDEALIEKLDAVAKAHHRKRSPEINVAVEFYLKYHEAGIETQPGKLQDTTSTTHQEQADHKAVEETTEVNMGGFGFDK